VQWRRKSSFDNIREDITTNYVVNDVTEVTSSKLHDP